MSKPKKQKKTLIHAFVIMHGVLQENGAKFNVTVDKAVSLDQVEQIAMFMKHSVDQARAQIAQNQQQQLADSSCQEEGCEPPVKSEPPVPCSHCDAAGHSAFNCPHNTDSDE